MYSIIPIDHLSRVAFNLCQSYYELKIWHDTARFEVVAIADNVDRRWDLERYFVFGSYS